MRHLASEAKVFDIGCGNNSPRRTKAVAPKIWYVGLDVDDYNQDQGSLEYADVYIRSTSADFASAIESHTEQFDAVISSHNLEHCTDPNRVVRAMCAALKPRGRLYLSFPSQASAKFPRRARSTLNFFDDPTHREIPEPQNVLSILQSKQMHVDVFVCRHRPLLPLMLGVLLEPASFLLKRSMPLGSTWALYGFETVIWCTRASMTTED